MKKRHILLFVLILSLVSCKQDISDPVNEGPIVEEMHIEEYVVDVPKDEDIVINVQEPLVEANSEQILADFMNSQYAYPDREYEIKHIFETYGNTTVVEIALKDETLISTNLSTLIFDDVAFVIPTQYTKGSKTSMSDISGNHYLLCYTNETFCSLNYAYENKLLNKDDLLDLKTKCDDYYYNGDAWYERLSYVKTVVDEDLNYLYDNLYIDNGILSHHTTKENIISYELTQEEYKSMMNMFYEKYPEYNGDYIINYYGNIDGKKIMAIYAAISVAVYVPYVVGNYILSGDVTYECYVFINENICTLKKAYNSNNITETELQMIVMQCPYGNKNLNTPKSPIILNANIKDSTKPEKEISEAEQKILVAFDKSAIKLDGYDYKVKNVFGIYGNSIVLDLEMKGKDVAPDSYSLQKFDDVAFVIPSYQKGRYLVVYNQGKLYRLKGAYLANLLTKEDLLDLKVKFDEYYYDNDLWYERLLYPIYYYDSTQKKSVKINGYINKGIFSEDLKGDNLIDYTINQETINNYVNKYYEKYTDKYKLSGVQYLGNIDGIMLIGIAYHSSGIRMFEQIGNYQIINNRYFVCISGQIYSVKEAYDNKLIDDNMLRYVEFYQYLEYQSNAIGIKNAFYFYNDYYYNIN